MLEAQRIFSLLNIRRSIDLFGSVKLLLVLSMIIGQIQGDTTVFVLDVNSINFLSIYTSKFIFALILLYLTPCTIWKLYHAFGNC